MKKKLLAIVAALMAVTCSGCGNRASSSTQTPPAYNGGNNGNTGGNQANNNVQHDPNEYVTYGDYVIANRDEIISGAKSVTYQQLARSTDGMADEHIKIKGMIAQVYDDGQGFYSGAVAITRYEDNYSYYYDDLVLFNIPKEFLSQRPLESDIVTMWGVSSGLTTYETVRGDARTEPSIVVAKVQFEQ